MANELNFEGGAGLTVVGRIYAANWVQQGGDVAMVEGAAGLYSGSVPLVTVPDGEFSVLFVESGNVIGNGSLIWVQDAEVDLEHMNALLESDQSYDFSAGTLTYQRRQTLTPIIPAKDVVGQQNQQDTTIIQP